MTSAARRCLGAALALLLNACVQTPPPAPNTQPAPQTVASEAAATAAAVALIGNVQGDPSGDIPPDQLRPATGERPQLDAARAARMDVEQYLAQGPAPWRPAPLIGQAWTVDLTVAADGSGTHRTVQSAIDAVPERAVSDRRVVIQIRPGVYRERVCVPAGKAPITWLGDPTDASAVVLVGSAYGGQAKRPGVDIAHPCQPDLALPIVGTLGSATVIVAAPDFQAAHLTIANDALEHVRFGVGYPPGASESGGAQGVALTTQADRVQLDNLRLVSHQDTLYLRRPAPGVPARVFLRASLVEGDVDFVFGNATLVVDDSTLLSRADRLRARGGGGGPVLAPSTVATQALGFLVQRSRFIAEAGLADGSASLGRAWDEGVPRGEWKPGISPNGQALIRDSLLGPHLALQAPWAASTSRRPFTAMGPQAARMVEFNNTVLTGDPRAREVLSPWDGWASAAGGVTGGAAAFAADVHTVRNRAELERALASHGRPRIVRVEGRIDLSTDAQGRPLGFEDFRDSAFSWEAFERAYDPATWGRRDPAGPVEDARKRSATRQARLVTLKVPSHTTLIGVGDSAHITNGMLALDGAQNVIVRHLRLSDAFDHFPAWEPDDNVQGEWNSLYDNLSLRGATRVWIDHCRFDDGGRPDSSAATRFGRRVQHHDGLLDITHRSNHVTVSWSVFADHEKAVLVGSSDNRRDDEGTLKVTFHHNLWQQVSERTPRVRFGQVHVYNNLFDARVPGSKPYGYSLGIGFQSRLFSQANVWETAPEVPAAQLARVFKGTRLVELGSLHNGQPVDIVSALRTRQPSIELRADVGWTPTRIVHLDPAQEVTGRVRAGAGPGRQIPR